MKDFATRYALLTPLPLLQGIGGKELAAIEDALQMDLDEMPPLHHPLIRQGDPCHALIYLVEGKMRREYRAAGFMTVSYIQAPAVIEADHLFGLDTAYSSSYFSETDITILNIPKHQLSQQLLRSEIFRINLLNMLSALTQKTQDMLTPLPYVDAETSLRRLVRNLFHHAVGSVELHISMEQLASFIHETRLTTSRILNKWQREGIITLRRQRIIIDNIQTI